MVFPIATSKGIYLQSDKEETYFKTEPMTEFETKRLIIELRNALFDFEIFRKKGEEIK